MPLVFSSLAFSFLFFSLRRGREGMMEQNRSPVFSLHQKLLDRALSNIQFFLPNILMNLEIRINIACLSMLRKILITSIINFIANFFNFQSQFELLSILLNKIIKPLFWLGTTPINSLDVLTVLLLVSKTVYLMRQTQQLNKTALQIQLKQLCNQ